MLKDDPYLPIISQNRFFELWNATKTNTNDDQNEIYNFFKPYIESIPKLALGEYYWQIFNNAQPYPKILMAEGAVHKLTPTNAKGLIEAKAEEFFLYYLPNDLLETLTFITMYFNKLFALKPEKRGNFNITIYARIKNNEGAFLWNSLQYPALYFDESGSLKYGMALYTNVHHLMKPDAVPMMTILDSSQPENQLFTYYSNKNLTGIQLNYPNVSSREKEVIAQLCNGKSSKQIAYNLGIKKNTVDNHRQRLLKKFGVKSSAELVIKAMIP
jgi:DNA-binding CsgD family transcriptional regulator